MLSKKKILVVDDDPVIRDVFKIILEAAGYEVELTGDGRELLKNQFSPPHLFLIDKLLSGVNGLDICKHLKAQKATKNIPVIMISASPGIAGQSAEAGADDHIEKPFDRSHLLKVVSRNISNGRINGYKKERP